MGTPTIRLATQQDIGDLISLYAEFHDFHVAGVPDRLSRPDSYDEPALQEALHAILQRDDAAIFVADSGRNCIGLAEVYLRQGEPHLLTIPHRYGFLQSLIVSAPFRKSGRGTSTPENRRSARQTRSLLRCSAGYSRISAGNAKLTETQRLPMIYNKGRAHTAADRSVNSALIEPSYHG